MHDFIEKPSRMILVIIGLITLVTIGILLARSGMVNPGGESLVNSKRKPTVTKAPLVPKPEEELENTPETEEYQEVYADDGYDPYEEGWEADTQQPEEANTQNPEVNTQEPDYQENTEGQNDQADEGEAEPGNGEEADADPGEDNDAYWDEVG